MIIVTNREMLIPDTEQYIGTTYDTESENRVFRVRRFSQRGVDLSVLTFRLDLTYENEGTDTLILSKEVTDEFIFLTWEITSSQLQVPGTVKVGIRAIDDEVTVKWSTFTAAFYVERHLNTPGNYTGDLTEIEQMEQDHQYMLGVVDELRENLDYRQDAEAYAVGTRLGEDVPETDEAYHNNSKYYKEVSDQNRQTAEAYAKGTVDGVAVESGDIGYHDNSKYYSELAAASVNQIGDHFGTIHKPYMHVYGDIECRGRWSSAQALVKWGNYFIAINAYDDADGGAVSSANGCDIIVLDANLAVVQWYEACAVGHGGGACVLNDKLYICGDSYNYKYIITEIDLTDLTSGTYTAAQLAMDTSHPIYSIATDGAYLYGSEGWNIWRFTPSTTSTPELQCRLPYSTQQDISISGTNLYVPTYTSTYGRNRIEIFDLRTGDYIDEILLPFQMGDEFKEIESMCNIGTETDPNWLVYFNSDTSGSNYILQLQFKRSLTTVIPDYIDDPYIPYPFTDRDDNIYYKPSHHGKMLGNATYPFNTENLVQRAVYRADRYVYIRVMEDVDSLTIIGAKRQLYIGHNSNSDYNHAITTLNIYYCDIVDVLSPCTNIVAYKTNVLHYANLSVAPTCNLQYIGRFITSIANTVISYVRNSYIEAISGWNITISESIDSKLLWLIQHDNIDATSNIMDAVVIKDNGGSTNGTPGSSRGILEIKTGLGLPVSYDSATFNFITITGIAYCAAWYKANGTSTWTKSGWKQITTTAV